MQRPINRQQRRIEHKLSGQELYEMQMKAMEKGINGTLSIVYKVMNEQFGFSNKRLDRLENAISDKFGEEK